MNALYLINFMQPKIDLCPLCGGARSALSTAISGYVEGTTFQVMRCDQCNSCSAAPLSVDKKIYEAIYSQPERIAGYARYERYAETILHVPDPLTYLATREPCYWALTDALRQASSSLDQAILEVGCGLGYFTFALTRAGYKRTVGIDLSGAAVARARERYGCDYRVADIVQMAANPRERFDAVVLSEVIEHLEDPFAFIDQLRRLLKPGGRIILTTPSRSFAGHPFQAWATDPPPVHLWWFTESGISGLARRLNMQSEFTDFSEFNRRNFRQFWKTSQRTYRSQIPRPLLNARYEPCRPVNRQPTQTRYLHSIGEFFREQAYRLRYRNVVDQLDLHRSAWIGATLKS